ncbi:YccF domain-containing protein [Halodesulfovibrio spirochaetisodalis]|uniref:Membrane protein n=1 Tax=Halodesulfovibrio spirochaetisodalis TaxID=1560234 RepID=A0A1B7XCS2_9BACT|nr:YccF domain-containing protein [Halodesulfovibrio spirochaetisodalis]OBQ51708.1 membrane protein [Halodesulfovibrio spirochaetisodalis]
MLKTIMNILWLVLGGLEMALGWFIAGIIMIISIVGIPWARSCFVIGMFTLWPFGKQVVNREEVTGVPDIGTGCLGLFGNIIWFIFGGFWLAIGHLLFALMNFITIIGIPFGFQHLKLAVICLAPVGKSVIDDPNSLLND